MKTKLYRLQSKKNLKNSNKSLKLRNYRLRLRYCIVIRFLREKSLERLWHNGLMEASDNLCKTGAQNNANVLRSINQTIKNKNSLSTRGGNFFLTAEFSVFL